MKDPWRDPKGDPFGEEGSGALDDFLTPFARCDARGDCRDSHSSVTDRAPGSWHLHNSAMWQRETEARSRFLMTGLRGVPQLRDRWRGQKKNRGKEMLFGMVGTTQELVFIRPGNENALWLALRSQIASQLYQHWALPVILVMPSVGTVVVLLFQDKEISPDPGLEFFLVWSPGLWSGIHFWTTLTCNSPLETQDSDLICETTPTFYSIIVVFIIFISCGCLPCTFWLDVVYFLHLKGPLKIVWDVDHAVFFVK